MTACTERAPRPADAVSENKLHQQSIQVDIELVNNYTNNPDKSFKNWKKAKNGGVAGPCTP